MKPAKTKETCATCGKPLPLNNEGPLCIACARAFVGLPPAPQSEAASNVCVCRHMPCPVYPCPCACHRQGPHVPTDECDEAASDVRLHRRPCKCEHRWDEHAGVEPRFCLVPDCGCQCFIPAHTQRADEITVLEEEFDALAGEIAALRAEVKSVRALHLGTEKGLIVQRDAAEARVETLEKALREIAISPHSTGDTHGDMYGIGVQDGHRCAATIAAAALKEKP